MGLALPSQQHVVVGFERFGHRGHLLGVEGGSEVSPEALDLSPQPLATELEELDLMTEILFQLSPDVLGQHLLIRVPVGVGQLLGGGLQILVQTLGA